MSEGGSQERRGRAAGGGRGRRRGRPVDRRRHGRAGARGAQRGPARGGRRRQAALLRRRRPAPERGPPLREPRRGARLPPAAAPGRARLGRRPAHAGAAEHRRRLVHAGHGRVARRRRLDEQHLPRQRPALRQPHGRLRPRRAPGRDDRPGGRARRQEGRADRVGRRPRRRHRRPDARLPQLPLGPRRGHQLHRAGRLAPRSPPPSACSSTIPTASPASPPSRRRRPRRPTGWTDVPASFSPAQEMRLRVLDAGTDKYGLNAYLYDSRDDGQTAYDRVLFSPTKDGDDAVGDLAEGEWADVKVTIQGSDLRRQDGRDARQGRAARARPLAGPALPHVGDAGDRHVAGLARRARLHGRLRGLRRRALPVLAGRRLRRARGRHRERGDLRRAGPVLGEGLPAADPLRAQHLRARPGARRLSGHGRVPAPVPRPRDPPAAQRRGEPGVRRRRGRRHARRPRPARARASSGAPTAAPTRRCASPSGACRTPT